MQNSPDSRNIAVQDVGHSKKLGNAKTLSKTTIANPSKLKTTIKDHSKDKELINHGLHKLVSSFSSAQRISRKASKLDSMKKNSENFGTIPAEKGMQSHIVLNKQVSVDKCTMTECENKGKHLDIESTVLGEPTYRDLQWTDPRLIKKYSMVRQQKSMTIPYVDKSEGTSEVEEKRKPVEEKLAPLRADQTNLFLKVLYYFCTCSASFVGTMCGITLITLILWKALDGNLFNFQFQASRSETFLKRMIFGGPVALVKFLDRIFESLLRLLTISGTEVYTTEEASWMDRFRN